MKKIFASMIGIGIGGLIYNSVRGYMRNKHNAEIVMETGVVYNDIPVGLNNNGEFINALTKKVIEFKTKSECEAFCEYMSEHLTAKDS